MVKSSIRHSLLASVFAASAITMGLVISTPATAQITTSEVVGFVTSGSGAPVSGATVTVTNTSTGFRRTVTTGADGSFALRNLPVSGYYDVSAEAPGFQGKKVEQVALLLGNASSLSFVLESGAATDEIIVVGQRQVLADVAIGPSASFGLAELEDAPAINRNLADIIRMDPRIYVDESFVDSVQCGGQSPRFNSFTMDGVDLNDAFGLNANGYPTERQPYPYDAIEQVSVEMAPFDTTYGGFTACNINTVTKSGTNEFHGSAFFDYTNNNLRGDKVKDVDLTYADEDQPRWGLQFDGPIIKDRLFFNIAYEGQRGVNNYAPSPVSDAALNEIASIASTVYQYDVGTVPTSNKNFDDKVIVKLDWNITDNHRATGTYMYNDGNNIVRSDGDSNEFEFSKHLYERGAKMNAFIGALYSDWTDNFSTELRAGYQDIDMRQVSEGGTEFGEIQVRVGGNTVYLGADDSRQSNDLDYSIFKLQARGQYDWNNHAIGFGYELRSLDIYNLFVQHTQTELRFNSIDDFRNGFASRAYYNNAPSHNPDDAAADWGYRVNTIYGQDDFQVNDALSLVFGLRYDWYATGDKPTENPDFLDQYGFSNSQTLDGKGLWQPRLGFTWDAGNDLQLRGGAGLFSGGDPNVWLSNTYSANNVDQVGWSTRNLDLTAQTYTLAEDGVPNYAGWAIPQVAADAIATGVGSNFEINYLDPDFKIPSIWKFALGASWNPSFNTGENIFGGDWNFNADLLFSKGQDTAIIQRGDLVQDGTQVIDGVTYPTYDSPNMDSFVLTNSDKGNEAFVFSVSAAKNWDHWSARAGYAYSDAKDVQPMTSSVAFSNYNNRAYLDPQEQVLAPSNYNIKNRFTGSVEYRRDWWTNYDTKIYAYFQHNSGRPYSRVYDDPNDFYGFTPFLDGGGVLLPGTKRNEFESPSWTKIDLKLSQDLPGLRSDDRSEIFMVIDNFTNLINHNWGILEQGGFPGTLTPGQLPVIAINPSTYEIRFGARYDF